jgi:hypothetical protein
VDITITAGWFYFRTNIGCATAIAAIVTLEDLRVWNYNISAWPEGVLAPWKTKPIKVFDGVNWVERPLKAYNGSNFVVEPVKVSS